MCVMCLFDCERNNILINNIYGPDKRVIRSRRYCFIYILFIKVGKKEKEKKEQARARRAHFLVDSHFRSRFVFPREIVRYRCACVCV